MIYFSHPCWSCCPVSVTTVIGPVIITTYIDPLHFPTCCTLFHKGSELWRTIILPFVLYWCETWSLTLEEEHILRVFECSRPRQIFEHKREEVRFLLSSCSFSSPLLLLILLRCYNSVSFGLNDLLSLIPTFSLVFPMINFITFKSCFTSSSHRIWVFPSVYMKWLSIF